MKVEIIKNVIFDGKGFSPGAEIEVLPTEAENLKRIGCGIDPEKSDIENEKDSADAISGKVKEIETLNKNLVDAEKKLKAKDKEFAALGKELVETKAKLEKMAKINQEFLKQKPEKPSAAVSSQPLGIS